MFESHGDFIAPSSSERRRITGLQVGSVVAARFSCVGWQETRRQLGRLLEALQGCGWALRDIFLLGFSQVTFKGF